jgi:hypothetical protein
MSWHIVLVPLVLLSFLVPKSTTFLKRCLGAVCPSVRIKYFPQNATTLVFARILKLPHFLIV